ncbi:MAG: hypothetical protein ACON46_06030 [Coraliomargaritaceae bacterium]
MIKKLFILILLLVVSAFALVYFFGASWVTQAVETFGPKVTQTPVRLDEVKLSPLSESGTLKGLYIGNPQGYKNEHIFSLNQIDVEIEAKSLLTDEIIVNKIHIRSPEMNYEKTLRGSNINSLLDNVESFGRSDARETVTQKTAPAEPAKTGSDSKPSKKVLIRELLIEDLQVSVGLMGAGTSVTIPRIEMQDLDSSSTKELVAKVLKVILNEVSRQIGAGVSGLGQNTLSGLEAVGKQALGQKQDEILKQADQEIEKVQKELEETVEPELIKGIKNLFGK